MLNLALDRASDVPLYRQLVIQLGELIRRGILPPGERLPPIRRVADELGLTRLTVQTAFAELQSQGLVESFVGRGTFVATPAEALAEAPAHAGARAQAPVAWLSQGLLAELTRDAEDTALLSFAQAYPAPETYPTRDFVRILHGVMGDPSAWSYAPLQGEEALREQVSRLVLERGVASAPAHILITAGAQQGIDVALRALTQPGDVVLVEEPTYPGMIELAAQRGQRVVGVPMDEHGLSLEALEEACERFRPALLYTIPTFHNPTGVSLPAERRQALLRIAHRYHLLVVEDDAYGFLGFEEPAPPPLKALDEWGQVVFITSFSKMLLPGLRLGALIADPRLLPRLAAVKQSTDLVCSPVLQRGLASYLRQGLFARHLERIRPVYRERARAMLAGLAAALPPSCAWTHPAGGLSVWVTLPPGLDERDVYRAALARDIGVACGQVFFVQPQRQGHLRLSFGAYPPHQIERAMAVLGEVVASQQRERQQIVAGTWDRAHPLV